MVHIVQEQAQLVVDVARPQVLRRGAEQHDLVLAPPQVAGQRRIAARAGVAEVVRLVHQYDAAIRVLLQQVHARYPPPSSAPST